MEPTRQFSPSFLCSSNSLPPLSSAEDAPEELQEGESQVNNIVYTFRLTSTTFDKKSYMTYLKVAPSLPSSRTLADPYDTHRDT